MTSLPRGWAQLALGEALRALLDFRGRTPKKLGMDWGNGTIPALSALNVRQGAIDLSRTSHFGSDALYSRWMTRGDSEKGDVVVTTEAPLGNVAQIPDQRRYILSQRVVLLKPGSALDSRFLAHQLRAPDFRDALSSNATGTTATGIKVSRFVTLPIRVAPLPEQKRIADKLDSLTARIDTCRQRLERIPAILKRFRQSVLAAATSGELTREWREEHPSLADASTLASALRGAHEAAGGHRVGNAAPPTEGVHDLTRDMFPAGWALLTLRNLVQPERPITYGILKPGPELADGVPYVRVADFPNDRLNLATIRKTSRAMDEEFKRSRLRKGDLLLSIRGTVGRLISVPRELENANITQDTARLSIQTTLNSNYVLWALRSDLIQQRMKGAIKGVAVRGINIGDVRALQVPLPSRQEQDEIARRVEELIAFSDSIAARFQNAALSADRLDASILAKAFRGELVRQNPNDEPAWEMLERLRTQRSATTGERPSRSRGPSSLAKLRTRPKQAPPKKRRAS